MNIYKAFIVYNKYVQDLNLDLLVEHKKNIIVFDNGEECYRKKNKSECEKSGIVYLTKGRNAGLAVAYNSILDYLFTVESDFYITWFDDDTKIPVEYLQKLVELLREEKVDVILPVVRDAQGVLSPSNIYFDFYSKRVREISEINKSRITAINSGMCISSEVYKKFRYDERMFLDYIDHYFMKWVRENRCNIVVVESEIYQNFSEVTERNIDAMAFRHGIFVKDFMLMYNSLMSRIYIFLKSLRKSIQNKDIIFLKILFKAE